MSASNPTFFKTFSRPSGTSENSARRDAVNAAPTPAAAQVASKITRVDQGRQRPGPLPSGQSDDARVPLDPSMVAAPSRVAAPSVAPPASAVAQPPPHRLDPPAATPATPRFDSRSPQPPPPHVRNDRPAAVSATPQSKFFAAEVQPFHAAWEVDVFDIPPRVADLFFEGRRFSQIAERIHAAVQTGLRSILVTSATSGEGRSTVALGIAMSAAAAGIQVALVDGDTHKPTLAESLRLEIRQGWIDCIRGGLPIKEVAVHALEDGVTLIPLLAASASSAATPFETSRLIGELTDKFDLIIIDGPAQDAVDTSRLTAALDTAMIVRDVQRTSTARIEQLAARLNGTGLRGIGVVENFT